MRSSRHVRRLALAATLALVAGALSAAAPARATYPGRNGRIAFSDFTTGQIYSINPDGSGLRQLTDVAAPAQAFQPSWSPDGKRIVFSSDVTGEIRIHVMDADGSHERLLAHDVRGYRDMTPVYTPDGRRIVFSRCKPNDGVCAIYSMSATDGTDKSALTTYKEGANEAVDFDVTVSPDGRRVAFGRFFSRGIFAQVWVMDIDGSREHALTPPRLEGSAPDWSPDGHRLAFHSNCCRDHSELYAIAPDGHGLRRVTHPPFPHNDIVPSHSPSGGRLTFSSDREHDDLCCLDLYVANRDGTSIRRITTDLPGVIDAAWGPAASAGTTFAPGTSPTAEPRTGARLGSRSGARGCGVQPWLPRAVAAVC
jgi:Tol biopolymer transport system component